MHNEEGTDWELIRYNVEPMSISTARINPERCTP